MFDFWETRKLRDEINALNRQVRHLARMVDASPKTKALTKFFEEEFYQIAHKYNLGVYGYIFSVTEATKDTEASATVEYKTFCGNGDHKCSGCVTHGGYRYDEKEISRTAKTAKEAIGAVIKEFEEIGKRKE